ncbi:MAG TPA: PEGA domain-containing protein [Gammaproteobacteria bacterium]|nr:PEGA domain-containing protein [Gammaproteobacteria bacterium]
MTPGRSRVLRLSVFLATALSSGCSSFGTFSDGRQGNARILISSTPAGATVYVMGRAVGKTPLEIRERDIYPLSYRPEAERYYGTVTLEREGCARYSHRLRREEVYGGLLAQLDCGDQAPADTPAEVEPAAAVTTVAAPPPQAAKPAALPARRLNQLRVLQELLDEGILTAGEEARLRRRLLEAR